MQTKTLPSAIIFLLFTITAIAQTGSQPFADLGKKVKTLTLTNGKYEEFFDDDSIQQIGTALVNINTMKLVKFQLTKEEQRIMENSANSRFLSVDPLTRNFAMLTPYQYASNKPINSIDIDGAEAAEMIHWIAVVGTSRQAAKLAAPTLKTIAGINEKQTQYIFGFSNGVVSAFDIQGLVQTYQGYSVQAMKELFSMRMNTFMTEDMSYEDLIKQLPIVEMARDSYYNLKAAIDKAYSGDAYAAGQVQAMCLTACIGGLAAADLAALRSIGGNGIRAAELLGESGALRLNFESSGKGGNLFRTTSYNSRTFEFNTSHSFERTHTVPNSNGVTSSFEGTGITMDQVETSITTTIDNYMAAGNKIATLTGKGSSPTTLQTTVNGKTVEFHAGETSGGQIKISDYYIK